MKWELNPVRAPKSDLWMHALIATITGYDIEEILQYLPAKERFSSSDMKSTIESLGYSCSKRFIKFDPNCENPSVMRAVNKRDKNGKQKSGWYPFIYYDRRVYYSDGSSCSLKRFISFHSDLRITTMLEVHI